MKLWMRIENIVCSPDMYKNILDQFSKILDNSTTICFRSLDEI